jgi:hypothetical protein
MSEVEKPPGDATPTTVKAGKTRAVKREPVKPRPHPSVFSAKKPK